ncbi:hypothetical protein [Peromfec virus RodF5_12]|uniref:Uncharacterized protein n=1 Tax=Peromfec virus RodF5_12 TaxID=2929336 RepID=A0A976N272_9VIRU|nr:hypothetical protein [Peromfec virus RodF5_12]
MKAQITLWVTAISAFIMSVLDTLEKIGVL